MRFSLETIAEGLETDTDDPYSSRSDILAHHLPPILWKRIRKTESLLGLLATSCCLASKKRPDLMAPLSRMKASIRTKRACLRKRALTTPSSELSTSLSAPSVAGLTSTSSLTSASAAAQRKRSDGATTQKNNRALEFTCEFMERMCQRVITHLCVSQLDNLTYDVAEQLANVVEDVGVLDYEVDTRQPMDDVTLSEIINTFVDMALSLPYWNMERFGRHFVHELKSKFDGDGAWLVLSSIESPKTMEDELDDHPAPSMDFSIWNVKDYYLWLRVGERRSYVIMHGLPGRKTHISVCQSDLDFLLKDTVQPYGDEAFALPEPDALRTHFESVYGGRWHCVKGESGRFFLSSSKRLRHEARMRLDDLECHVWQW